MKFCPLPGVAARADAANTGADAIEIELANGRRVRVRSGVDGDTLKRVIALLEE